MKLENEDKSFLVQACINSYDGKEGAVDWTNVKAIKKWNIENNEGYHATYHHKKYGKIKLFVFQGSRSNQDNGLDWIRNFKTKQIKIKELIIPYGNIKSDIRIHKGFFLTYIPVRESLRKEIKKAIEHNYKVWITGHSLGAAMATLCYADINYMLVDEMKMTKKLFWNTVTGYAAASPKVGNKAFVESFDIRANGNFYNEFYGNDLVHQVPRWWQGYQKHVKIEKRYSNLVTNIQMPFVNILKIISLGFLPSLAAHDHFPQKLLAAIKNEKIPTWIDCIKK